MIKEGIEALASLAVKAATPQVLWEDDRSKLVVVNGAVQEEVLKIPKPRHHHVYNLGDVISLANRFKEANASPVVWYGDDLITLVIDGNGHRIERADLKLSYSDVFLLIKKLHDQRLTYNHRSFVKMLRTQLYTALPSTILLDKITRLEFESGATVVGSHKKGEESMGKSAHAKVSKVEEIPNDVVLEFPVYNTRGLQAVFTLKCLIEIDAVEQEFQLLPVPDGVEGVMHRAMDMISSQLEIGLVEVPFYQGKP